MGLHDEVAFLVDIKIEQLQEAINSALGVQLSALAVPSGTPAVSSPWSPLPTLDGVVSGQSFDVQLFFSPSTDYPVEMNTISLDAEPGLGFDEDALVENVNLETDYREGISYSKTITVTVEEEAEINRPYFFRPSILQNRYSTRKKGHGHLPHSSPAMVVQAVYEVDGELVKVERKVRMRRANLPQGYKLEPLKILPKVAINASPSTRMIPVLQGGTFEVEVEVMNNDASGVDGDLSLEMPEGWISMPEKHEVQFSSMGERNTYTFEVNAIDLAEKEYEIQVLCTIDDARYREGYQQIERNELGDAVPL